MATIWACGECGFTTYEPKGYDYECPNCKESLQAEKVPDGRIATDGTRDD